MEQVTGLFCNDSGYQTSKLDTRAAIFKILLVHENDGSWSLPGGWVEVNLSLKENTLKEIKEETGLDASAERIIALHDRNKHNPPKYAYGVCKVFVLCQARGGSFSKNIETTGYAYFAENNLPQLALAKNNEEQVKMCFQAYRDPNWEPVFD
ncbi:NUDIX family hydrolase [Ligilactobacillus agilis]|uniref:NUDIX family hydrolase n=1 Tax=Ligilactobacillus agilis TaxID=1601 RepID=A0A6F9Y2C1_9LACO|nr:NUDIX family hydrolase [Ligilactobacillus agilis]